MYQGHLARWSDELSLGTALEGALVASGKIPTDRSERS